MRNGQHKFINAAQVRFPVNTMFCKLKQIGQIQITNPSTLIEMSSALIF